MTSQTSAIVYRDSYSCELYCRLNITVVCEGFNKSSLHLQPWRRIFEICKRLIANDNSVTIVSDGNDSTSEPEIIDTLLIHRISNLTTTPIFNKRLLTDCIEKTKPDIVVWCGSPLSAIYLPGLKSLRKPLIWDIDCDLYSLHTISRISIQEIMHPHHRNLWQQILTAILPRFIIRSSANSELISRIIVSSNYHKLSLQNVGVEPSKIAVISSTINKGDVPVVERRNDKERRHLRTPEESTSEELVVAYFGSPCTLRGPDTIIESIPEILKEYPGLKLVIFSRRQLESSSSDQILLKNEEGDLVKLARKLGVEEHVKIYSGTLDRQMLRNYLQATDIIVLPFKLVFSEPPLSIFEAMALGKIVVTTKVGSLPEIVGNDRGFLIEPGSFKELAETVLFVAGHPDDTMQIKKNAQQYVASLPTWDQIACQFAEILNETSRRTAR